jgi:Domain of unknown function DUF11
MRNMKHAAGLVLATGLGLMAVALAVTGFATTLAAGPVDLVLDMRAPAHVAPDSTFVVNIAYANIGTGDAPDVRVTATLPDGAQFITATDRFGAPLLPSSISDNVLVWNVGLLPANSCCDHILITEKVGIDLIEGTALTNTASIATTTVESNTTNNTASAVSIVCEMAGSVKQVHAGEVMPGDVLTYTIVISRARRSVGPMDSAPLYVGLTDTLPFSHQVRFLGWTSDVTGTHEGQMLRWQGQVRAGELLTLQYRLGVEGVITPGTVLTNIAHLGWNMGHMQLGPVTTVVTLPHDARMIGPNGDELRHAHGVTLTVPPGAVTETTRFHFQPLFTGTQPVAGPPGLLFAHRAFELTAFRWGESVHQFGQPLTITVHYSDTDVTGLRRETLRLWYRNGPGEPWAMLGEPARVMSGALAFTTTHFSQFALFAESKYRTYLPVVTH